MTVRIEKSGVVWTVIHYVLAQAAITGRDLLDLT